MMDALLIYYAFTSFCALAMVAADKGYARRGLYRVAEGRMFVLATLGGWPGTLFGMSLFRNKNRKEGFRGTIFLCAVINVALVVSGTSLASRGYFTFPMLTN